MTGRFGAQERNLKGQMVVDFAKRKKRMAGEKTLLSKRERKTSCKKTYVTYCKRGDRRTGMDDRQCRRRNMREHGDCMVVTGECSQTASDGNV